MNNNLTPDQIEKRKRTNKKIFKFGCLPILVLVLLFALFCTKSKEPATKEEKWQQRAVSFQTVINETKDIDNLKAAFDSLQVLKTEFTPTMAEDSTFVKTNLRITELLVNKEELIDKKGKVIAQGQLFSSWDGSNAVLVKYVKSKMNDPDSFEHVETLVWEGKEPETFIVKMTFRGKNAFGGTITNTASGIVYYDGNVKEIDIQ